MIKTKAANQAYYISSSICAERRAPSAHEIISSRARGLQVTALVALVATLLRAFGLV